MIVWTRKGLGSEGLDSETDLYLLIEKVSGGFDFNGYVFPTEAEARAFADIYAADAIVRHKLGPTAKAQRPVR